MIAEYNDREFEVEATYFPAQTRTFEEPGNDAYLEDVYTKYKGNYVILDGKRLESIEQQFIYEFEAVP